MSAWLVSKAPVRFVELLYPDAVKSTVERTAVQANPPHLLLSGPSGIGKTATWRLIARQVLGPSWNARTHVLQARDLARTSGQCQSSKNSSVRKAPLQTTRSPVVRVWMHTMLLFRAPCPQHPLPRGKESTPERTDGRAPVSRLIVIEDADYLGTIRQSYLRRMMESASGSARFTFHFHTPLEGH